MVERRRLHCRFLMSFLLRQAFSSACLRRILYLMCFQFMRMRELERFHPAHAEFVICDYTIENRLHWVLDIAFREDESRMRKDHSQQNFVVLRHMALNLLKQEQTA